MPQSIDGHTENTQDQRRRSRPLHPLVRWRIVWERRRETEDCEYEWGVDFCSGAAARDAGR
jgi:hypothetical protein